MKIFINIALILLTTAGTMSAQTVPELIATGLRLERQFKEEAALFKFKQANKMEPKNYQVLCKVSYLYSTVGFRLREVSKKKEYYRLCLSYAKKAYAIKPRDAESNYLLGLGSGRIGQISSAKVRVSMVYEIEKWAKKAIAIDPGHALANILLGRLNYRVANASQIELAAAKILFGGMPKGFSNENARALYMSAIRSEPANIIARRDLAYVYIKMKNYDKAKFYLRQALTFKPTYQDDYQYLASCKSMLAKLAKKK